MCDCAEGHAVLTDRISTHPTFTVLHVASQLFLVSDPSQRLRAGSTKSFPVSDHPQRSSLKGHSVQPKSHKCVLDAESLNVTLNQINVVV